jgi:hypothetical protein
LLFVSNIIPYCFLMLMISSFVMLKGCFQRSTMCFHLLNLTGNKLTGWG